ncbi:MAG TPA: hypothetical protein VGX23_10505 [Actinocrinis sp.]|nr:hypothetical protein [Actinocrinis sp.]
MPGPQRTGPRTRPDAFPTGGRYVEALQHTRLCFQDPVLREAVVTLDRLGMPRPISGNFASVFALTEPGGRRYAVKCFTQNVTDQQKRYNAISRRLAELDPAALSQPWKMEFEYLDDGILVDGFRWPILKMAWMDGVGLLRWLEQNYHEPGLVAQVADRFLRLVLDLESAGVAHGDLQHGNLLVAPDNTLRLVDYDGMYVGALAGLRAAEEGHRHYQSPKRHAEDFGPAMDRFSAWLIYLSLQLLAHDPGLWPRLHDSDGEFLLLEQSDFAEPGSSLRLSALESSSPLGRAAADHIRGLTATPLAGLPVLDPVAATRLAQAAQNAALSRTGAGLSSSATWILGGAGSNPAAGGATGLGATANGRTGLSGTLGGSSNTLPAWITDHVAAAPAQLPQVEVTPFARLRIFDILCLVLSVGTVLAAVLLAESGTVATVLAALLGVTALPWLDLGRRFRPEVKALRRYRRDYARLRRRNVDLEEQLAAIDRQAVDAEAARGRHRVALTEQRKQLSVLRAQQIAEVDRECAVQLAAATQELAALDVRLREQIAQQLMVVRQAYIAAEMAKYRIEPAVRALPDLGRGAADKLIAAGIHSAADFVGIRLVVSGRYSSKTAYFILRNGREVRISSFNEHRARVLENWRRQVEARAMVGAPTALDPAREAVLRRSQRERTDFWRTRRTAVEAVAKHKREVVNRDTARTDADLSAQLNALTLADSQASRQQESWRRPVEFALADSRAVADAYWQGLRAARVVSFWRYLLLLFIGW